MTDDGDVSDRETAEMQDRMSKLTATLSQRAFFQDGKSRLYKFTQRLMPGFDPVPWRELYRHWKWLWENPDGFENGDAIDSWKDGPRELWAFELGVLFGIDYEQAYPEGRNDEWPIPVEERGTKPELDRGTKPIPLYVLTSLTEQAEPHHEYAVVRSDNDYQFAESLDEANEIRDEMQSSADFLPPIGHTVQVIELQEVPPEA